MIPGIVASGQMIAAGSGSGGSGTFKATVTIASGTVGSTLTDFPVMVRLDDMPAGFWTHCRPDGGDIRVKTTGGTFVPMDLVRFDYESNDGVLFFLASSVASGSDSSWDIHYGDDTLNLLDEDDTDGMNAVWAAYEAVFLFGPSAGVDRTGGNMADFDGQSGDGAKGTSRVFTKTETSSTDLDSHNGICWDGTNYYTTDDNAIYKWDSSWTLVTSNTDPIGDAAIGGTPTIDHCGDLDVFDGKLYIPMEAYPAVGGLYNAHIGVFDASDLSFIEAFDITAQAHEASSIAYCSKDGLLYITDYDGNTTSVFKYDPADGSYIGTLTADTAITKRQGITWFQGAFYISSSETASAGGVYLMSYAGAVSTGRVGYERATITVYEGIGHRDGDLLQLIDPGTTERVERWTAKDEDLSAGGGITADVFGDALGTHGSWAVSNGRTSYTTYTLAASLSMTSKGQNRTAVSYWDESAGTTNTRQVIAFRLATPSLAIWDANNSWLEPSPAIDPTLDTFYRVHAVYQGTTSRRIYVNGAVKNTQNTITAVPSALDTLRIMSEDTSNAELWSGKVGFVYLYPGVLSADWIAAEYDMLNAPGTFCAVGSEESV